MGHPGLAEAAGVIILGNLDFTSGGGQGFFISQKNLSACEAGKVNDKSNLYNKFIKIMKGRFTMIRIQRYSLLVIMLLAIILSGNAFAALTPTVVTDMPLLFDVKWTWDPEADGTSSVVGTNWDAFLNIIKVGDNWNGEFAVQHLVNPHPGESLPGQTITPFSFAANDSGQVYSATFSETHPGQGHSDNYTFLFDRSMWSPNTSIHLTGADVPIPGAVRLLGSGLIGLGGWRRFWKS